MDDLGGWPAVFDRLVAGRDLEPELAGAALEEILRGEATPARAGAFLIGLRCKGEAVAEVSAMVDAMLRASVPLRLPEGAVDVVGTGGSEHRRRHALNVSTMSCFVAAAAGAVVCKHGNRKASSTSGSFDLLELLGIPEDLGPAEVEACVREVGIGFCFARKFHPAMRHVAPVRSELGVPTVFNILGPLSHPGRVRRGVVGVSDPARMDLVAGVLAARSVDHAWVVWGEGGIDELANTGTTFVTEVTHEGTRTFEVRPEDVGLPRRSPEEIAGGDPSTNAAIFRRVLDGEKVPARDAIAMTAGAALVVSGVVSDLAEGVGEALRAIDTGAAAEKLEKLRAVAGAFGARREEGG